MNKHCLPVKIYLSSQVIITYHLVSQTLEKIEHDPVIFLSSMSVRAVIMKLYIIDHQGDAIRFGLFSHRVYLKEKMEWNLTGDGSKTTPVTPHNKCITIIWLPTLQAVCSHFSNAWTSPCAQTLNSLLSFVTCSHPCNLNLLLPTQFFWTALSKLNYSSDDISPAGMASPLFMTVSCKTPPPKKINK